MPAGGLKPRSTAPLSSTGSSSRSLAGLASRPHPLEGFETLGAAQRLHKRHWWPYLGIAIEGPASTAHPSGRHMMLLYLSRTCFEGQCHIFWAKSRCRTASGSYIFASLASKSCPAPAIRPAPAGRTPRTTARCRSGHPSPRPPPPPTTCITTYHHFYSLRAHGNGSQMAARGP